MDPQTNTAISRAISLVCLRVKSYFDLVLEEDSVDHGLQSGGLHWSPVCAHVGLLLLFFFCFFVRSLNVVEERPVCLLSFRYSRVCMYVYKLAT